MRELVLPWGRSQEPNAPRVIGFDITLSHWLLFNLELPQSPSAAIRDMLGCPRRFCCVRAPHWVGGHWAAYTFSVSLVQHLFLHIGYLPVSGIAVSSYVWLHLGDAWELGV